MERIRKSWVIGWSLVAVVAMAGCGGGEDELAAARQARLAELQTQKADLDGKRQEVADIEAQLAAVPAEAEVAAPPAEGEAAGEPQPTAEELQARLDTLNQEVLDQQEKFIGALVQFINDDPPLVGEPPTESQVAAIRMKSDEDILLARDYISEGGDYKRAIRIYEDALKADPDNEKLQAALAQAEADRFMSADRFSLARKGMTQDEVRAAIGQVNYRNVREYPERNVVAWFYPTSDDGAAAGVYFRKDKRSGEYVLYQTNYEAVEAKGAEQAAEDEG